MTAAIPLSSDERATLEALAGSRDSEARTRDRARIVLLAASSPTRTALSDASPNSRSASGRTCLRSCLRVIV